MRYFLGCDLARKRDWTVAVVIDSDGNARAMERFHQISWNLQVERVAQLYRTFRCSKCVADATGIGDVVVEQLEEAGLNVESYVLTVPSRKSLIEELILAFDNCEITIPDTEKFQVMKAELESFEFVLDGTSIRYSAPPNQNDDTVFALALAVHAFHSERSAIWGMVQLLERRAKEIAAGVRDAFGELIHKPKPKPLPQVVAKAAIIRSEAPKPQANQPCPACKSTCTILMSGGIGNLILHCNMCGCDDGKERPALAGQCCGHFLPQVISGGIRCGNCGWQSNANAPIPRGATFAELVARRASRFGRFG